MGSNLDCLHMTPCVAEQKREEESFEAVLTELIQPYTGDDIEYAEIFNSDFVTKVEAILSSFNSDERMANQFRKLLIWGYVGEENLPFFMIPAMEISSSGEPFLFYDVYLLRDGEINFVETSLGAYEPREEGYSSKIFSMLCGRVKVLDNPRRAYPGRLVIDDWIMGYDFHNLSSVLDMMEEDGIDLEIAKDSIKK